MKISFTRDAFMDVAAILSIADDGKHGGALFRTGGGTVTVMASDGTLYLRGIMAANVTEAGSVVLDLKKIDSICRAADAELIQIEVNDLKGTLVAGRSKFKLLALAESTYPDEPKLPNVAMATIRPSILTEAVAKVLPCVNDKHYAIFQGCYLAIERDIRFAGTDGKQIAEMVREVEKPVKAVNGVASVRTIQAAAKIANSIMESDGEHSMLIGIHDGMFIAQADDFRLVAPLLQGDFPKYDAIFPNREDALGVAKIVADKLTGMLSRAALATATKTGEVVAELGATVLGFRIGQKDSPDFTESAEVIVQGEPLSRNYSLRQLIAAVGTIPEGNEAVLEFGAPNKPLQITFAGDPGWRYASMPMLSTVEQ